MPLISNKLHRPATLSRQKPRVRVSSSPPFIPNHLGMIGIEHYSYSKRKRKEPSHRPGRTVLRIWAIQSNFLTILGVWKIVGVVALLIPEFPLLKEWAYAGFFFAMSGAVFSHIASGDSMTANVPALLLLILTVISWYFRPADRKIISVNQYSHRQEFGPPKTATEMATRARLARRVSSELHRRPCKASVALRRQSSFLDETCFLAKISGSPTIRASMNSRASASMFTSRR